MAPASEFEEAQYTCAPQFITFLHMNIVMRAVNRVYKTFM